MHKDFIHFYSQMERKACGCSEQEESYFLEEVQKEKGIISEYNKEIEELDRVTARLRKLVLDKEQERDKIINEYQKALKEYATTAPELRESQLIKLKRKLEDNRKDILSAEATFNDIDRECKVVKKKLATGIK